MLKSEVIQVIGRGSNVDFLIDDDAPFELVTRGLREYLEDNKGLWAGGRITVDVGTRIVSQEQLKELKGIIEQGSGLEVVRFSCLAENVAPDRRADRGAADSIRPSTRLETNPHRTETLDLPEWRPTVPTETIPVGFIPTLEAVLEAELPAAPPKPARARKKPTGNSAQAASAKRRWLTALLVKATCRSGETIRHDGDVVVLGDVNPGAEVIAEGDIVVFGQLRGFVHAGSTGDTRSTIVALNLDSPRIQIGSHVGTSSEAGQKPRGANTGPMIAYVRHRSIQLAPFAGSFANLGKGEPYDR